MLGVELDLMCGFGTGCELKGVWFCSSPLERKAQPASGLDGIQLRCFATILGFSKRSFPQTTAIRL
jgi:hypothetical protein